MSDFAVVEVDSSALPDGAGTEATLASLEGKDFATEITQATLSTEATLVAADTKLGTIDGVLDSIKDTDGIKKITDQLPAGANEIGKVAQGTKAAAADAWPTVLYDASGNPVSVMLDGAVYRIRGESLLVGKAAGVGANKEVSVIDDPDVAATKRLQVEMAVKPGSVIGTTVAAPSAKSAIAAPLLNAASDNMVVDGSVAPVDFLYTAHATLDTVPTYIRVTMILSALNWGNFGKGGGVLTNGISLLVRLDGAVADSLLFLAIRNVDFLRAADGFTEFGAGSDVIAGSVYFSGAERILAGSSDHVTVRIADELDGVLKGVEYLTGTLYGYLTDPV